MASRLACIIALGAFLTAACRSEGPAATTSAMLSAAAPATAPATVTAAARPTCRCHTAANGLPTPNALPATQAAAAEVEYHRDVAPLLRTHCLGCHRQGGIAPFALETYAQAATYALAISDAVAARRMPPFNARGDGSCQSFRETRWLSDHEIATLTRWAATGYMEGKPGAPVTRPPPPPDVALAPDVTLTPKKAYAPKPGMSPDSYRCFPLTTKTAREQYITAIQIQPGNPQLVHHAVVWGVDDAASEKLLRAADGKDGAPGSFCWTPDVPNKRFVGGWLPGTRPIRWPKGTGTRIKARQLLLLEVHYNGGGGGETDQTRVVLETRAGPMKEIRFTPFDAAKNFELAPGRPSVAHAETFQAPELQEAFKLIAIVPHMHTLGQTLHVAVKDGAADTCLVDVDRWNFHWQQAYLYQTPLAFGAPAGRRELTLSCTFDTTSVAEPISYGMHTKDEMCQALLAYVRD